MLGASDGQNYQAGESSNIDIGNPGTSGDNSDIRIGSDTVGSGPGQQNRPIIPAGTITATVAELAREVAALQRSQR
jgi:hypothetical protein